MKYTIKSAFINRNEELVFLKSWIKEEPNNLTTKMNKEN
jgi:hypothetical protein